MTIEESRNAFCEEVQEVSQKHLNKLKDEIFEHYDDLVKQFIECFKSYCKKIVTMQESGTKNDISYIQFSLMRSKMVVGIYEFRMDAYDSNWYGDKADCQGIYDVTPFFSHLENFSNELLERRRKYMQRITVCRVKQFVLEESDKYKSAVTEFLRSALSEATKIPEYEAIDRAPLFVITVGEFRDQAEIVYKEDATQKDVEQVIRLLATHKEEGHQYEIFDELDLSDSEFNDVRWLFCSGKKSTFINVEIPNSTLMFCQFEGAIFESANFSYTDLIGINFTNATLKNIDLTGTRLAQVNFENATLENIDFTEAHEVVGINLINTTLINVILPDNLEVA